MKNYPACNELRWKTLFDSKSKPGRVAQSVTCLATDASLTADQGVES